MEETYNKIWDPISADIPFLAYQQKLQELTAPNHGRTATLRKAFVVCCFIGVVITSVCWLLNFELSFYTLGLIPLIFYGGYVIQTQNTLVRASLCAQNGWVFASEPEYDRAEAYASLIPIIFDHGRDRNFEFQIWGNFNYNNDLRSFWAGKFLYTTGYGKSKSTVSQHVIIFRLPKFIPVTIILEKEGFIKSGKNEIKTESQEFNNLFKITTPNDTDEVRSQIIHILTPSVQTRLLDFMKQTSPYSIIFQNDMLIISLSNDMFRAQHTNLFLDPHINKRDIDEINASLQSMAELPTEMLQFMD